MSEPYNTDYDGVWSPDEDIDRHLIDSDVDELEKQFGRLSRMGITSVNYGKYVDMSKGVIEDPAIVRIRMIKDNAEKFCESLTFRAASLSPNRYIATSGTDFKNGVRERARALLGSLGRLTSYQEVLVEDFLSELEELVLVRGGHPRGTPVVN